MTESYWYPEVRFPRTHEKHNYGERLVSTYRHEWSLWAWGEGYRHKISTSGIATTDSKNHGSTSEALHSWHLMVLYKASLMFLDIWYVYPNWTAREMRQRNSSSVKTRLFNCLDRDQLTGYNTAAIIRSQETSNKRTSGRGVSSKFNFLLELAARDKKHFSSSITSASIPNRRVLF